MWGGGGGLVKVLEEVLHPPLLSCSLSLPLHSLSVFFFFFFFIQFFFPPIAYRGKIYPLTPKHVLPSLPIFLFSDDVGEKYLGQEAGGGVCGASVCVRSSFGRGGGGEWVEKVLASRSIVCLSKKTLSACLTLPTHTPTLYRVSNPR